MGVGELLNLVSPLRLQFESNCRSFVHWMLGNIDLYVNSRANPRSGQARDALSYRSEASGFVTATDAFGVGTIMGDAEFTGGGSAMGKAHRGPASNARAFRRGSAHRSQILVSSLSDWRGGLGNSLHADRPFNPCVGIVCGEGRLHCDRLRTARGSRRLAVARVEEREAKGQGTLECFVSHAFAQDRLKN